MQELEHYLGLTGWIRQYVLATPPLLSHSRSTKTEALRKAPSSGHPRVAWTKTTQVEPSPTMLDSYTQLQAAFSKSTILIHRDPSRPPYVDVNASKKPGFGAMIYHVRRDLLKTEEICRNDIQPVLFLSRQLSPAESRYWPTEMKKAGLVWILTKINNLIMASLIPTIVFKDHSAATAIARQTALNSSSTNKMNLWLVRALQYLSQFQLDI